MNTNFLVTLKSDCSGGTGLRPNQMDRSEVVFSSDLTVRHVAQGNAVIIGDIFPKGTSRERDLDQYEGVEFCIRQIANGYWGRFVAIVHDPATGTTAIYRDPSGMIPCYYVGDRQDVAIGTDAGQLLESLNCKARIDWHGVVDCLVAPDLRRGRTCLSDVFEIVPGQMITIDQGGVHRRQIWSPGSFLGSNVKLRFEEAATLLHDELVATLDNWVSLYPHLSITVSGGFDSSAISVLARNAATLDLLHFFTTSPRADERPYVETLGHHLGRDVRKVLCGAEGIDVGSNRSSYRPWPSARCFTQIFDDTARSSIMVRHGAAHVSGGGGDNVFGKLHSAYPLADQYRLTGLSSGLVSTAFDICDITGSSLPDVLRQAFSGLRKRHPVAAWPQQTELLTAHALTLRDDGVHPWLEMGEEALPGQRQLVRNIARAAAATDYLNIESECPTLYPLLSQTIIELCLSFPTWYWFSKGRDRSLARSALDGDLPSELLDRTGKGAFDGLLNQVLEHHRSRIFNDLTTGLLADQGLIDVGAIQKAGRVPEGMLYNSSRILHIHEIEMWCRHWGV